MYTATVTQMKTLTLRETNLCFRIPFDASIDATGILSSSVKKTFEWVSMKFNCVIFENWLTFFLSTKR